MASEKNLKREPLAYISKRDNVSLTYRIAVRAIAIVLALIACGIVTKVLTGDNPISIYQTIVHGAVGKGRLLVTIHDIAILLCISLAVTPAFRMRFAYRLPCHRRVYVLARRQGSERCANSYYDRFRHSFGYDLGRYSRNIQGAVEN